MFRALLAHPQEILHKRNLVYCLCVMSGNTAAVRTVQWHFDQVVNFDSVAAECSSTKSFV
jgi:hypothetical protein